MRTDSGTGDVPQLDVPTAGKAAPYERSWRIPDPPRGPVPPVHSEPEGRRTGRGIYDAALKALRMEVADRPPVRPMDAQMASLSG